VEQLKARRALSQVAGQVSDRLRIADDKEGFPVIPGRPGLRRVVPPRRRALLVPAAAATGPRRVHRSPASRAEAARDPWRSPPPDGRRRGAACLPRRSGDPSRRLRGDPRPGAPRRRSRQRRGPGPGAVGETEVLGSAGGDRVTAPGSAISLAQGHEIDPQSRVATASHPRTLPPSQAGKDQTRAFPERSPEQCRRPSCGRLFTPRVAGRPHTFRSPACRRAFDAEARRAGARVLGPKRRTVERPARRRAPSGIDVATGRRVRLHVKPVAELLEELRTQSERGRA
jgi:hypothetical protein